MADGSERDKEEGEGDSNEGNFMGVQGCLSDGYFRGDKEYRLVITLFVIRDETKGMDCLRGKEKYLFRK